MSKKNKPAHEALNEAAENLSLVVQACAEKMKQSLEGNGHPADAEQVNLVNQALRVSDVLEKNIRLRDKTKPKSKPVEGGVVSVKDV